MPEVQRDHKQRKQEDGLLAEDCTRPILWLAYLADDVPVDIGWGDNRREERPAEGRAVLLELRARPSICWVRQQDRAFHYPSQRRRRDEPAGRPDSHRRRYRPPGPLRDDEQGWRVLREEVRAGLGLVRPV